MHPNANAWPRLGRLGAPPRPVGRPAVALIAIVVTCAVSDLRAGDDWVGRVDPALTKLVTPLHSPPDTYRVLVSEEPLDRVARTFRELSEGPAPDGAWESGPVDLMEAFGSAGRWDRARTARLYGGSFPRMARGPIFRNGRVVAGITLVTPFPDPRYSRLIPGTLIVIVNLERLRLRSAPQP